MILLSELVGQKGVYFFLNDAFEIADIIKFEDLNSLIEINNIRQEVFADLVNSGFFSPTPEGFAISSLGKKVTILLRGINGDTNISQIINNLYSIEPELKPYELISENITEYFINSLYNKHDFIRINICSPWIRLDAIHLDKIRNATINASKIYNNIQIKIITLPLSRYNDNKAIDTIREFKKLGAEIVVNSRLHAKLYISEPGPLGGKHYAIFGSENLTARKNIELAIKIENDNDILRNLNAYFFEIFQESQILKEV